MERGGELVCDVVGVAYYNRSRAWIRDVHLVRVGARSDMTPKKRVFVAYYNRWCSVLPPVL